MAITLETVVRNAACDAAVDLVDAGGGAGYVEIYDAAVLLVTIELDATAFGAALLGVATGAGMPRTAVAVDAGTADSYKVYDNAAQLLWSGTVTVTGGSGDLELDTTSIIAGDIVAITSWTHTVPAV